MPREIMTAASAPASWVLGLFLEVLGLVDDVLLVVDEVVVVVEDETFAEVLEKVLDSGLVKLVVELVCGEVVAVEATVTLVELADEFVVVGVVVVVDSVDGVEVDATDETVVFRVDVVPLEVAVVLVVLLVQSPPRSARKIERTQRVFICKGGEANKNHIVSGGAC